MKRLAPGPFVQVRVSVDPVGGGSTINSEISRLPVAS